MVFLNILKMKKFYKWLSFLLLCNITSLLSAQCIVEKRVFKQHLIQNYEKLNKIDGIWTKRLLISTYKSGVLIDYKKDIPSREVIISYYPFENIYKECRIVEDKTDFSNVKMSMNVTYQDSKPFYKSYFNWSKSNYLDSTILFFDGTTSFRYSYEFKGEILKSIYGNNTEDGITIKVEYVYSKLFPIAGGVENNLQSTGTGFAIKSDGYIITNAHVVNDAGLIKVRGINGDFKKSLNAYVYAKDEALDIAILKIDDSLFTGFGRLPYTISYSQREPGTEVFVLGYPLISTMGTEIKLTNGIISSKSGFMGNSNQYQITVPIQPGNSGGPMFDMNNNVIGIISSKHKGTDNVSYAIKSSYLKDLLSEFIINQEQINGSNSKLEVKVKSYRNFIYLIEIY